MPTSQALIDGLLDRLAGAGNLTTLRMFGGHCLYLEATPVGLVFRNQLFVKWTTAGRELLPDLAEGHPFPGSRPYLAVDPDQLDGRAGRDDLCRLLRVTLGALPPPRPRRSRSRAED